MLAYHIELFCSMLNFKPVCIIQPDCMFGLISQTERKVARILISVVFSIKRGYIQNHYQYEGCSNMNASSFIIFFTYMLRQNVLPFLKELYVAFRMAPNIKKHLLYFSSYRPLYKSRSSILKFF